jgi:hypothetical protein
MDQRNRGAVAVTEEDELVQSQRFAKLGQHLDRFNVHEVHSTRTAERVRGAIPVARVGEHSATRGVGEPLREFLP